MKPYCSKMEADLWKTRVSPVILKSLPVSLQQLENPVLQGRTGPSLLSRTALMNSIFWFMVDAPLSWLLRQPPTVFPGGFKYAHVMFPPKTVPCLTWQPHMGSVPAKNPNFRFSNFKACSTNCNKSQSAPFFLHISFWNNKNGRWFPDNHCCWWRKWHLTGSCKPCSAPSITFTGKRRC